VKTYVATKNEGKLRELRALFAGSELELDVYPEYVEVEETGDDYAANALIKARGLRGQLAPSGDSTAVLADDSGIEVEALGGRPGVLSARYAGGVSWPERRGKMLGEMRDVPEVQRGAKFVCAMVLVGPDGRQVASRGEVEGVVARHEEGGN
jgi:XTP/dITP diphosphohydrolase